MRLWKVFAFSSSLYLLAGTASAATYYVSTSGNDANPGTLSAPFRTITKSAGVVRAGDEVAVRGGVYNELVKIGSRGTASARIAFHPYAGEAAVVDGTGTTTADLVTITGEYVDFSGFEVRNSTKAGICGWGVHYVRILNNVVHDSVRNGIYLGYGTAGNTYGNTIEGNTVRNNVLENQFHTTTGGWGQSIGVQRTDGTQINGNNVYNNDGEGVAFILSTNGSASGNTVYDNYSVGMYLDNATSTTIDGNFIYSTGNSRYYRNAYPAAGIGAANESYSTSNPLDGDVVTNNIVVNSRWGFYYGNYGNGGGLKNFTIANNTFYKAAQTMLWIDASTHLNTVVENNIFDQVGGTMTSVGGSGIAYRNNNWYGGTAGAAAGAGDILGDPRLSNAGGLTAGDYRLTLSSAVLRLGVSIASLTRDYFGGSRTGGYDIGAHQFSTGSGATADLQAPSTPAGVSATATSSTGISVTWSASSDNLGVTGYKVYRNGSYLTSVASPGYDDQGLAASTTYSYGVLAYDAAGNQSAMSTTATLSTLPAGTLPGSGSSDTQAPNAPSTLRVSGTSTTSATLAWNAATDNVGVTGYRIYRNGAAVGTTTSTSWSNSGLTSSTTYSYYVVAYDAASNVSAASNTVSATTNASKHKARVASH